MAPSSGTPPKQKLRTTLHRTEGRSLEEKNGSPPRASEEGGEVAAHFFLAANNYLSERHHAQERFRLLQEAVAARERAALVEKR